MHVLSNISNMPRNVALKAGGSTWSCEDPVKTFVLYMPNTMSFHFA